jgi:hypothetical protein
MQKDRKKGTGLSCAQLMYLVYWTYVQSKQEGRRAEFPDLDSENSEEEETGKDITGTDIESQNQEAEAAADDVLPF